VSLALQAQPPALNLVRIIGETAKSVTMGVSKLIKFPLHTLRLKMEISLFAQGYHR
jgi:hypothetical protein